MIYRFFHILSLDYDFPRVFRINFHLLCINLFAITSLARHRPARDSTEAILFQIQIDFFTSLWVFFRAFIFHTSDINCSECLPLYRYLDKLRIIAHLDVQLEIFLGFSESHPHPKFDLSQFKDQTDPSPNGREACAYATI